MIVAEMSVLLRDTADMPTGFKVATQELYEGWKLMRSGGVGRLAKKIQTRGWSFIKSADGLPRSGVGKTSQEAVDSALTQALQRVGVDSNAVEVERIELTQYPWFYLARVRVHPYQIHEGTVQSKRVSHDATSAAARTHSSPRVPSSSQSVELYPQIRRAMPMLKDLLTGSSSRSANA